MPLITAPNRGYADWQRLENYDSGALFSASNFTGAVTQNSGILDMSRYGYIGGYDYPGGVNTFVDITWYVDAGGTTECGSRFLTLAGPIGDYAQYRLPNLGPFVNLEWAGIGSVNLAHSCVIFGTNRVHPCELIPVLATMVDEQTIAIPNGFTVIYPTGYFSGPCEVWFYPQAATVAYAIEELTPPGNWDLFYQIPTPGANVNDIRSVVMPSFGWRFVIANTGGATTASLTVTPSLTGAS
jgi:hypothetical protein